MTFLTNPRGKKAARKPARRAAAKRKPPKGFATWKAYMASIRPNTPKGGTMAKKKKTRRRASTRRHVHAHHAPARRRRYRHNPPKLTTRALVPLVLEAGTDAAAVVAGKVAVRLARSRLGMESGTAAGSAVEGAGGVVLVVLGQRMRSRVLRNMGVGALAGALEGIVKTANVPVVSATLGDIGDLPNAPITDGELAGYIGAGQAGEIAGYVGAAESFDV